MWLMLDFQITLSRNIPVFFSFLFKIEMHKRQHNTHNPLRVLSTKTLSGSDWFATLAIVLGRNST